MGNVGIALGRVPPGVATAQTQKSVPEQMLSCYYPMDREGWTYVVTLGEVVRGKLYEDLISIKSMRKKIVKGEEREGN